MKTITKLAFVAVLAISQTALGDIPVSTGAESGMKESGSIKNAISVVLGSRELTETESNLKEDKEFSEMRLTKMALKRAEAALGKYEFEVTYSCLRGTNFKEVKVQVFTEMGLFAIGPASTGYGVIISEIKVIE
jgi:hypothetical protein